MRLIALSTLDIKVEAPLFQFQSGAINREMARVAKVLDCYRFNSNLVRLIVFVEKRKNNSYACFNSNLVRLIVQAQLNITTELGLFQFQSGAINS